MLFRFKTETYSIKLNKVFMLLCLFFFGLFCMLGVWQLHRFHYKQVLLSTYQNRLNALPKPLVLLSGSLNDIQFQPIAADGHFVNELTMFIQNRIYQGKAGFEVLTPLRVSGENKLLLIDRGWVQKPEGQALPQIIPQKEKQHIVGYIKRVDEYQFILGKNILEPVTYPLVMQKIDLNEIGRLMNQTFYPFVVRLDPAAQNGFVRDWVISATPPERHRMYAIQWFSLALVILIAYLGFSVERVRESDYAKS